MVAIVTVGGLAVVGEVGVVLLGEFVVAHYGYRKHAVLNQCLEGVAGGGFNSHSAVLVVAGHCVCGFHVDFTYQSLVVGLELEGGLYHRAVVEEEHRFCLGAVVLDVGECVPSDHIFVGVCGGQEWLDKCVDIFAVLRAVALVLVGLGKDRDFGVVLLGVGVATLRLYD